MISQIQYITQDHYNVSHEEQTKLVCEAGIDWVQLRVKDDGLDLATIALNCRDITSKYGAKLIINDNPHVARVCEADGVHVGLNDTPPSIVREIIGDSAIIGGTANTWEDIVYMTSQGVNYIGCGPFRFTKTKKDLSPVLGIHGYQKIINQKPSVPIIAIGGINEEDVSLIIQTGVYGVAISGLLFNTTAKKNLVSSIQQSILNNYETTTHSR